MTESRIDFSSNGTVEPTTPKRVPRKRLPKPKMVATIHPNPLPKPKMVATFGVAFMAALSAALNGYANSLHATVPWAGWALGLSVPIIVLVLAKVAGTKYKASGDVNRYVAYFAGLSGVALLLLSVWHCALSIALLTGGDMLLTVPMAVAIDCGLVACEVAIITE